MKANSLRTRGVVFAYLFGPPRFVRREEAYRIHAGLCQALGREDLSFQYNAPEATPNPRSQAFSIQFQRKEGRGAIAITIDNPGIQQPIRLVVNCEWPQSTPHVTETTDETAKVVFDVLEGKWQKVLAEVRLRAQCDVAGGNGLEFMKGHLFSLPKDWFQSLGEPLVFSSAKFCVAASTPTDDSMTNPKRELSIELLRDDPGSLYLELMSQWPQIPEPTRPDAGISLGKIRAITDTPSEYIHDAYRFLEERVSQLQKHAGG